MVRLAAVAEAEAVALALALVAAAALAVADELVAAVVVAGAPEQPASRISGAAAQISRVRRFIGVPFGRVAGELVDQLTSHWLDTFGIVTRQVESLPAIFTAPFLHAGWNHLIANSGPFAVLGFLVFLGGLERRAMPKKKAWWSWS